MDVEVVVVGAGVVGLACGAELARKFSVLVLERHPSAGQETSSRNSEVIHAGLYYPSGSLKAELCVRGRAALYERCTRLSIPYRKLGKLVVATEEGEIPALEDIERRASENGAGLEGWRDQKQIARIEPRIRAVAALWSPQTGIIDAHALIASYQAELASRGGECVFHTRVGGLERISGREVASGDGWEVLTETPDGEPFRIRARCVVNAAGLGAARVAELAGIDLDAHGLRQYICKGDYFSVAPSLGKLTQHLVYPVPVAAGLGVHVTLDMGGRYRLGPDVEYVESERLDVDPDKAKAFAEAARRYLPELEVRHLTPDFAGLRPKLQAPGAGARDFVICEASEFGAPGLIHLGGIESPGLTSTPAIAERVGQLVENLLGQ